MLSRAIFVLCVLVMSGCSLRQNKTTANLQFTKIQRVGQTVLYDVYFSSDIDIWGPYRSLIGVGFVCALEDHADFRERYAMKRLMAGSVKRNPAGAKYGFIAAMLFSERVVNGSSERDLTPAEIKQMLARKTQVPCKFFASATMMETYFSNVMYVPVADIFRAIEGAIVAVGER
ncbi:hypothetical protein [Pseudomonas fluorescens]|uniref:hypothetical protein n=1 Tax=Pseudomonas fluorescens TaxID=294 RepID=UPI001CA5F631|nr:hypothetical protein [Pseudomonas fluorescens]MBY8936391.1 hypothetical protein [Pseudomonas fluorescens]